MAQRDQILEYCNEVLKLHEYSDYGPMGLQYAGKDEVKVIATAVSASAANIVEAGRQGADLLIVHHGLFWNNESRIIDERHENRFDALHKFDITLLAYHLALDAHPKIGNNILAARALGLGKLTPWQDIAWTGQYKEPMFFGDFTDKIEAHFPKRRSMGGYEHPNVYYGYGPPKVSKVAVIVGGAPQYIIQAHRDGFDTFFSGEVAEPTLALAQDLGMNFVAAGHDATEQSGVQHLAKLVGKRFKTKSLFVDSWNPA